MKRLERNQMKNLKGGLEDSPPSYYHVPGLVGYMGGPSVGYCICDFYCATGPNNCCQQGCPIGMCNDDALDPNPFSY